MDRFTFAQLTSTSEAPLCPLGYIAEFGSRRGQTTYAKYVQAVFVEGSTTRVGEPVAALINGTSYTASPYMSYKVTNSGIGGLPTGGDNYVIKSNSSNTINARSIVGVTAAAIPNNYYGWVVLRGPIANNGTSPKLITTAPLIGSLLKAADDGSSGMALTITTADSDYAIAYTINAYTGTTPSWYASIFVCVPYWW